MTGAAQKNGQGLVRGLRRWDLVAVAINGIVGAGIFGLPSKVYSLIGVYSIFAFAACALVVTMIILCFAEVGGRFTGTGGPYLYAREAFGPAIGFEVGWLMWLARLTSFAANLNLMIEYVGFFWKDATSGVAASKLVILGASMPVTLTWRSVIIVVVVIGLTGINVVGVRDAASVSNAFTIGKLALIILFIITGLFFVSGDAFSLGPRPGYAPFSQSVLILVYVFTGFEMAVIPAGEADDPRRNLPQALLIAIATVVVIYILLQIVCVGTLPDLGASERPLADASTRFLGLIGGRIIAAGALISILGNLNVRLLGGSRLPFAMAEQGELPRVLAATHSRFRTPHAAILLTASIMLVLALSGTFVYAATISTLARLVAYGVTCSALPVLRRRKDLPTEFKVHGGVVIAAAALILSVWLLSNSNWREARDTAVAAAIGGAAYLSYKIWISRIRSGTPPARGKEA